MQQNLLVTLANTSHINQAKQLFSSVYFNAGWNGDYMLLAYNIPDKELEWFLNKGILVKKCEKIFQDHQLHEFIQKSQSSQRFRTFESLSVILNKFYLFTPEFKKWGNIVYLDSDIIVTSSLAKLTTVKGFAATENLFQNLGYQFVCKKSPKKLKNDFSMKEKSFCTGIMAFDTNIIREHDFQELKKLFRTYNSTVKFPDQTVLNIFFYKKWQRLSVVYNVNPYLVIPRIIESKKVLNIFGIIIHFFGEYKPWYSSSFFYAIWKNNLEKAELIDLKIVLPARKLTDDEVKKYCQGILIKKMIYYPVRKIDKLVGTCGIFLKNNFPKIYGLIENNPTKYS